MAGNQVAPRREKRSGIWGNRPQPIGLLPGAVPRGALLQTTDRAQGRGTADPSIRQGVAKAVVAPIGLLAGDLVGGAHEIADTAAGALDAIGLGARLFNPLDPLMSPPGQAAWDHVADGVSNIPKAVGQVARDPAGAVRSAGAAIRDLAAGVSPWMTPQAPTVTGEFRRNFDIGQNQGPLAVDGAALFAGSRIPGAIGRPAALPRETQIAKRIEQGFSPAKAADLATDYRGRGHHFVPMRLWNRLGDSDPVKDLRDGPLNVTKPAGMSKGDFYEFHASVDPFARAARMSPKVGGGSWTAKAAGVEPYDALGRLRYGSPNRLKAIVLGGPLVAEGMVRSYSKDRKGRATE